ncbi:MAG: cyclic nucleotide-binding domain-containing protein [bacterium]
MNELNVTETEKQYVTANQVIRGVLDHLQQGRMEEAARLYSHCQEDVGYVLILKSPSDRALRMSLAKMFFKAKDYEKAAQVLEEAGDYKRAAELYERTDQYEQAAEMWAKLEDLPRSAHCFEKAGRWQEAADFYTQSNNFERAAYCFEKLVNHYLAGKYYFQTKKFQKSMELLQKVGEEEDHFLDATVLIGNILAMHGYLDMAVAKYKLVTKTVPVSAGSLSVYYNLAQLLERKGDLFESMKVYKEVSSIDPAYRDVADRIKKLEAQMADRVEVSDATGDEDVDVIEDLEPLEEEVTAPAGPEQQVMPKPARIVSVMEGFEFLKNTSLFDGLSLAEMKQLWNICENRTYEPGEIIIEQDRPGQGLYIIKKGTVKVQRVEGGQVSELVELGPGSHVGEMSLVDRAPTSARVVAGDQGAEAFEIASESFEELLQSDDKIAIKVYRVFTETFCERLRKTTAELSVLKAGG